MACRKACQRPRRLSEPHERPHSGVPARSLLNRSYQIQNAGALMGDFNSYFFFAAAAGLMAAAIAIAVISAFLHLREGAAASSSVPAAPVPPDAPAQEGGLAQTDEGIIS
jgi:hypothetical protein